MAPLRGRMPLEAMDGGRGNGRGSGGQLEEQRRPLGLAWQATHHSSSPEPATGVELDLTENVGGCRNHGGEA